MPPDDGPPPTAKGQRSRDAILRAAGVRFETDGFERTTVRSIANDAGIDPAMVMRYFGSKDRLFTEVTTVHLDLPSLAESETDDLGHALARHTVRLWGSETPGRALRILLRASVNDPDAAGRVRSVFTDQVLPLVQQRYPDADLRTSFVASQVLGYAFSRYVVRLPPLVDVDDSEAISRLGRSLQSALDDTWPQRTPR